MALTTQLSRDGTSLTISINGRFDFNLYKDFRDAYESTLSKGNIKFIINLSQTEYMDSSALGMLLVLKERTGGGETAITLKNCNKEIKNILSISNFDKLFTIE
ncbi:MAG: STAS domain-containing protein [Thiotrichaceae bacterium]|nr:STAS domain-containing protein [Thiotrichaceae bacterium]PCI15103.1 MAG: anti-anti-sigma factor [Thiotrichales bacterium]